MSHANARSDKSILRLPDGLRDEIKRTAADNGRSMNDEMVSRLMAPLALRDWFAGQIVGSLTVKTLEAAGHIGGPDEAVKTIAVTAYQIADAMLAARKGGA